MADGIGYRLALPPPRHERLARFPRAGRRHAPALPDRGSVITAALDDLAERLGKAGCRSCGRARCCPISRGRRGSICELLAGVLQRRRRPTSTERVQAAAARCRRTTRASAPTGCAARRMSHRDWIAADRHPRRAARAVAGAVPGGRRRAVPADADRRLSARPSPRLGAAPARHRRQADPVLSTSSSGPAIATTTACRRRRRRSAGPRTACRSGCRSSAAISRTARRSPLPG